MSGMPPGHPPRKRQRTSHDTSQAATFSHPAAIAASASSPPLFQISISSTCGGITNMDTPHPTRAPCPHQQSLGVLQSDLLAMRNLITCQICHNPMYEPFSLACGHTYCYSCLSQWLGHNKSCPDCRAEATQQPVPSYVVREMVLIFIGRTQLLPEGETSEEHCKNAREEMELVAKDKADKDNKTGGLFKGLFNAANNMLRPIYDPSDGVERCPACHWELEDGRCYQCRIDYDSDWYDDDGELELSEQDENSSDEELDHDLDELDHDAFGLDGVEHHMGRIGNQYMANLPPMGVPMGGAHPHIPHDRGHHYRPAQSEDDSTSESLDEDDSEGSMDGFINDDTIHIEESSDLEAEDSDLTVQETQPSRRSRNRRTIVISDDEDAGPAESIDLTHHDSDHEPLAVTRRHRKLTHRANQRRVIASDSEDSIESEGDESGSENGVPSQVHSARGPWVESGFSPLDRSETTEDGTEDSEDPTHYDEEDSDEQDEDDDSDSEDNKEDGANTTRATFDGPTYVGRYNTSCDTEDEDEGSS